MHLARSFTVGLVSLATGCGATASINSARDSSAVVRFSRLYVTVDQGNVEPVFAEALSSALGTELQQRGVAVKTKILSGLDLDSKAVDTDVQAWRPDGVVLVEFSGGSGTYGNLENATYNVSLVEASSGRRLWRAQVYSRRVFGSSTGMMEETAARVGERLEQDRLIGARR